MTSGRRSPVLAGCAVLALLISALLLPGCAKRTITPRMPRSQYVVGTSTTATLEPTGSSRDASSGALVSNIRIARGFVMRPDISGDGRFVAFDSDATTLVAGDTNGHQDVFVYDRRAKRLERVSLDAAGRQMREHSSNPAISDDGRFVVFALSRVIFGEDNDAESQPVTATIWVRDRLRKTTHLASMAIGGDLPNGDCYRPTISGDGHTVAFLSDATNLVEADRNDATDVFVFDLDTSTTTVASRSSRGVLGNDSSGEMGAPSLSRDGRYVAFESDASNLVDGDSNVGMDVFVRDLLENRTVLASVNSADEQGDGDSGSPSISADGRFVAFDSSASNWPVVAGGSTGTGDDVYVRDLRAGTTLRVSVNSSGVRGDAGGDSPSISGDGRRVLFISQATNLDKGAGTTVRDPSGLYLRDLDTGLTSRIGLYEPAGRRIEATIGFPAISADGLHAALDAWGLEPPRSGEPYGGDGLFVWDAEGSR